MERSKTETDRQDPELFVIHSPTRVTLGPTGREMARMWGMTDVEMVRHLLKERLKRRDD